MIRKKYYYLLSCDRCGKSIKSENEDYIGKTAELKGWYIRIFSDETNRITCPECLAKEKQKKDYTKFPWHDTSKELPDHSGSRCICYNNFTHSEMEMIFHKARKDSGYLDWFTECTYKGNDYDYTHIKYWRYYNDVEPI